MTSAPEARIGLTGATGVLGSALRRYIDTIDWRPFAGDVRQAAHVRDWLRDSGPLDGVMHLAAIVPTQRVEQSPDNAFHVNVGGTVHLLETLRQHEAPRPWVCVVSTSHVYGSSEQPIPEEAAPDPISLYGLTKLQSEQWALAYKDRFGLDVCVPRLFSYSDPQQAASYFLPSMVARLTSAPRGAVLDIRGAADTRDFSSTRDIADALRVLWQRRAVGVYNVASGTAVRVLDVADRLRQLLGRSDVTLRPVLGDRPTHLVADIRKMRALGWNPDGGGWERVLETLVTATRAPA